MDHPFHKIAERCDHPNRSYSGRGMYGKTCIGFTTSNVGELIAALVEAADQLDMCDELIEVLPGWCTDSMGLDKIIYFPNVPAMEDSDGDEGSE